MPYDRPRVSNPERGMYRQVPLALNGLSVTAGSEPNQLIHRASGSAPAKGSESERRSTLR
jgi:hypothetical protein